MSEISRRSGANGALLKNTALAAMVIDHLAAFVLLPLLFHSRDHAVYSFMRDIGRSAFPLYCFLMAEGAAHTADIKKYMGRVALLAAVSVVPFSLASYGTVFSKKGQNVFFTLLFGLLSVYLYEKGRESSGWRAVFAAGTAAMVCISILLNTDYMFLGLALILTFYVLRDRKGRLAAGIAVFLAGSYLLYFSIYARRYMMSVVSASFPVRVFLVSALDGIKAELPGCASFLLMYLYNGEKGKQLPSLVYYWFYPVHLLLFWMLGSVIF